MKPIGAIVVSQKQMPDYNRQRCYKPDRDNDTSVIRGPVIRKAGWLNSNGAVKHTAACEKSYISGVIRKSTEKPYFQKALPGAVLA